MKTHKIQNIQNLIDSRMKRFNNRTVIVTGGARGMGASHARGFIAEGANVVIAETELAAWRQVIDINLTGTYLGTRAVVPSMRKAGGGAIVNISSTEGMRGNFGIGAYMASKWGARGLTKTAALELGRDNIRVNSIHPGVIRTPMIAGPAAAAFEALVSDLAIPRVGEPDEITRLVLFVASDEASLSTGSEFIADGGLLLGPVPNSSPQGSNGRSRSTDSTTQPASRNKAI